MRPAILATFLLLPVLAYGQKVIPFASGALSDTAKTPGSLKFMKYLVAPFYANSDTTRYMSVGLDGRVVMRSGAGGGGGTGNLNTVLGNGNTSNRRITLKSSHDSVNLGIRPSDSTAYLTITRNGGIGIGAYIGVDSATFHTPVSSLYTVGWGPQVTVFLDACAGVGATYTVTPTSTYGHGSISITVGTSACASFNTYFNITGAVYGAVPSCVIIQPANTAAMVDWAAGGIMACTGSTTSNQTISRAAAPAPSAGTILKYYYFVSQ